MRDLFKLAMNKDIGIGGWKCPCCNPCTGHGAKRGKWKRVYHKIARSRMKREGFKYDLS
jgi:hypothetical protein